jgi:hypothetical protein
VELATGDTTEFRPVYDCPVEGIAVGGGVVYAGGGCEGVVALDAASGASLPWGLVATNIRTMLVDGEDLYVGGGLSVASGNSIHTGLVGVSTYNLPTPILGDFHAERTDAGVRLAWRMGDRAVGVRVERASAPDGPWRELSLTPAGTDRLASAIDTEATMAALWYRLTVRLADGSTARIGPIEVPALAVVAGSGITAVSPNPAAGLARIDLLVAVRERVRLSVLDIAGREVDVLQDGDLEPGAHSLLWDPRRGSRSLPAGIYFVRWRSATRAEQRRIVIAR